MQVEVLGTTFNISAYPQEEYQTTLVNGSVKVNTETGESCILKPSQQATISLGNSSIQIRMVDAGFYTSWIKENSFQRPAIGRYHENTITLV